MKAIYLSLMCLSLLASCSSDSEIQQEITNQNELEKLSASKINGDGIPENSSNPYDVAGVLHNELLSSYYEGKDSISNVEEVAYRLAAVASENANFTSLFPEGYSIISEKRMAYLLDHKQIPLGEVLHAPALSQTAKNSLSYFSTALLSLGDSDADYIAVYNFIVDFENSTWANPLLTAADKKVLLITSSLARHSAYAAKKKPKKNTDPEWDLLVGNRMGGAEGAGEGLATAIIWSLTVGIVEYEGLLE